MAESRTVVSPLVPLNGSNYPTWKLQCRMALVRDGLWSVVSGREEAPEADGERRTKFLARRDHALATIVLSIDPTLLYLTGADPEDPIAVWQALQKQFQRKTWANKLSLRRRLHSLHLRDGDSVQSHIKAMTELFNELAIVGKTKQLHSSDICLIDRSEEEFLSAITARSTDTSKKTVSKESRAKERTSKK